MYNNVKQIIEESRKLDDALSTSIKIDWRQVLEIVVVDLIKKRNCPTNQIKDSFDKVLRYYLSEEEFQKYVINGDKIK